MIAVAVRVVDLRERALDQARAGVLGDALEPHMLREAASERLGDRHRTVDELILGSQQGAFDEVARQVAEGEARFKAGHATAGDEDPQRTGTGHAARLHRTNH